MSTFSELKDNVSYELGLDETASGDDDVVLGRRLNEAVRRVLADLHLYVITGTITLAANDNEYELTDALSTDPLAVLKIINSDNVPLERVSVEEIHDLRRGTPTIGGSYVYKYALNGANLLMIYPTPNASGTLTAYYVPKPTEMSSAAHDPATTTYGNIPVQFHPLIELWACYRMASADDDASSGMGQTYKQLYDQGVFQARREMRKLGGRKLGPVRRSLGRRSVPRDPSQT